MFANKYLILISALSISVLFGCSNEVETEVLKENPKPIEATTEKKAELPIERVSKLSYEEAVKSIGGMTAEELGTTTEDVRNERIKLIEAYSDQYKVSEADSIQFAADLINKFAAGSYLESIDNDELVLTDVFKATIVEKTADNTLVDFAKYYNDSMKKLFLNTYVSTSEGILKNEAEMNKALEASNIQEPNK